MSLTRTIAHNTLYQVAGRVAATILAVFIIAFITRYLGAERFGNFTTIITFLQFFGITIDFGLMLVTVQMMSEPGTDQKQLLNNLFSLRIVSAAIILSLAPLVVIFFPYPQVVKSGVSAALTYFFFIAINQVFLGFLQKQYSAYFIAISEVIGRIFFFGGVVAVIYFDFGLFGIIGAVTIGTIVNCILNWIFIGRFFPLRFRCDWDIWKKIFLKSWPIAVGIILNLIYLKADTLILAWYHSQSDVGLYGAPYRVLEILLSFPLIFILFIIPTLTSSWIKHDTKAFFLAMQKSFDALCLITLPLVVGTWILSDDLMTLVAGSGFLISGKVLRIIIIATGILFLGQLFGHAIVAINKQKQTLWIYFFGAVLGLVTYFSVIPKYSYMGAAWATVGIEAFVNGILVIILWKYTGFFPKRNIFFKSAIASVFMGILLLVVSWPHVLVAVLAGFFLYVITIYFIGGLPKEVLRDIFQKNISKQS